MNIISNTTSDIIIWIGILISIIGSVMEIRKIKGKSTPEQISQESLTKDERIKVWVLALFNPVWTDIILYFGLRKRFPTKAKSANIICFIVFALWITTSILIGFPVSRR